MGKKIKPASENLESQFTEVLQQIQRAKQKTVQQVNRALVELYWNVGGYISGQVDKAGWGKSTVEVLAAYIQREEPSIKGFSARNIRTMRQFYETYQASEKLPSLVAELSWTSNSRFGL